MLELRRVQTSELCWILAVGRRKRGNLFGTCHYWRTTMTKLALQLKRFLESEDGPTAVEYAVMLALIVVVCLGAITSVGSNANTTFTSVANQL